MRFLLCAVLMFASGTTLASELAGQRFVSIAFHDVDDSTEKLTTDAIRSATLLQFFDWLKATGWTVVSLDDIEAANLGKRRLPDQAILITFDDGYASLYKRVFPLLKIYRFPVVAALVGSWMEERPDGTVKYGDEIV